MKLDLEVPWSFLQAGGPGVVPNTFFHEAHLEGPERSSHIFILPI